MMDDFAFLERCYSRPYTIGDLATGEAFILFPDDGDDSGHGGFRGRRTLMVKIEPYHPGEMWHESIRYTCHPHDRPGQHETYPLDYPVIRVGGVA